jgi:hypothetical protein
MLNHDDWFGSAAAIDARVRAPLTRGECAQSHMACGRRAHHCADKTATRVRARRGNLSYVFFIGKYSALQILVVVPLGVYLKICYDAARPWLERRVRCVPLR